jgi:predicted phosphodiesterase
LKIGLLLLSDIHFNSENHLLFKSESLIRAIQEDMTNVDSIFVCILGDIGNTGLLEEYYIAIKFFDELKSGLSQLPVDLHFLVVPGNHDCNFYEDQSIRNLLIEKIREGNINKEFINNVSKVQEDYQFFEDYFLEEEKNYLVSSHPLFKRYNYQYLGKSITFDLLNSAWISTLNEEPGNMIFPIEQLQEYIPQNKADLRISLVHHHLRWLHPNNSRQVEDFLTDSSDLIISGHEHNPTNYLKTATNNSIFFIECGALQENQEKYYSFFQTIKINLNDNTYSRKEFSWNNEINLYHTKVETPYEDISNLLMGQKGGEIKISNNFRDSLIDPGAPFQHPRKHKLTLQDIFVYPDLKELLIDVKGNLDEYMDMEELLNNDNSSSFIFTGFEKAGKSTLLKYLFFDLYNKGYYPLLLNGSSFKKTNYENVRKKIEEGVISQYNGKHVLDQYRQLSNEKKIILIDDWQKCPLNTAGKHLLMEYFEQNSMRTFITTNDLQGSRDLLTFSDSENREYRRFEINEFGHKKRAEIIEKWMELGLEDSIQEEEIINKKDFAESQLNMLVRKGHVPSFPFFILTILQSLESANPHQMKDSTKGHYYDVLIGDALSRMELNNSDIDIMKNYISHLSYFIFTKIDSKAISIDEFKELHKNFNEKYEFNLNIDSYKAKLIKSSLIYEEYDVIKFKYPYVYYYFVAKYLADNIERSVTKKVIKEYITTMANNLFNDEYANILMFLIHLSKNEYILSQVLNSAKNSFDYMSGMSLEDEVEAINALMNSVPKMVLDERTTVKENRKEMHEQKDRIDRMNSLEENQPNSDEDFETIEKINNMNQALKTIELIGQLLQNYPGYIEGVNKRNLSNEAIKTGLRLLNVFLNQIVTDKEYMLGETVHFLKSQNLEGMDDKSLKELAKKFLFNFCGWITFTVLKNISKSLGSRDTKDIIDKVIKDDPNVARRLIGISVSLDHNYSIPHYDITKLYDEIENNLLSSSILRRMVFQHLHLFEVPFVEKQKICSAVQINYKTQVKLGANTKQKALKL